MQTVNIHPFLRPRAHDQNCTILYMMILWPVNNELYLTIIHVDYTVLYNYTKKLLHIKFNKC